MLSRSKGMQKTTFQSGVSGQSTRVLQFVVVMLGMAAMLSALNLVLYIAAMLPAVADVFPISFRAFVPETDLLAKMYREVIIYMLGI